MNGRNWAQKGGAVLLALALTGVFPGLGLAASPEEIILSSLQGQGFELVSRDRTWLGRVRIVVESATMRREIVFNPGTGEVLRDYTVLLAVLEEEDAGSASAPTATMAATAGSSGGNSPDPSLSAVVAGGRTDSPPLGVVTNETGLILGDPAFVGTDPVGD